MKQLFFSLGKRWIVLPAIVAASTAQALEPDQIFEKASVSVVTVVAFQDRDKNLSVFAV